MSFSSLTEHSPNCGTVHRVSWSRNTSTSSSGSMLSGLKKKLSRRSTNPRDDATSTNTVSRASSKAAGSRSGGLAPPPSNNPFGSSSPSTRRPSRPGMNAFSTAPNEPPPAYTPRATTQTTNNSSADTEDDKFAFLKSFDTIFVIDDSGSMAGRSWRETGAALKKIAPICTKHDADGIDIYFLNHENSYKGVKHDEMVVNIFQSIKPGGSTPTGQRLNQILKPYLEKCQRNLDNTKPINVIVITDGEPSDDVESVIIQAAKKLDKLEAPAWQVGIQFFQVGNEPDAREHLKQLDDGLLEFSGEDELRDIVDTVPFTGKDDAELSAIGILKVVLGSVNRRLDRNSKELHRA